MSAPRDVQLLAALDREIAERRVALLVDDPTASEVESHRVSIGMAGFARQRTLTELKQTGWRPDAPKQEALW